MADKKRALVLASFHDAGSGKSFTTGETALIETGSFANYEAAGLVSAAPVKVKAPAKPKPKAKAAPRAKPVRPPVSVPAPAPTDTAAAAEL